MTAIRLDAPAKLNLFLKVLAREAGGYHGIETLFCAASLHDTVEVEPADPGIVLRVEGGVDTGPSEQNLAVRAAESFYREVGKAPAVAIGLTKRIPSGAGLGGGSSDAAATLRALDAMHGSALAPDAMLRIAGELGSDVPYFLCGSTTALGWNRGDRTLALPPLPIRPVLIAYPGIALPTRDAYAQLSATRPADFAPSGRGLSLQELGSWEALAAIAHNDFESIAGTRIPVIRDGLAALRSDGAPIAMLAGSGSAIFGVFEHEDARNAAGKTLSALGFATWSTHTLTKMPSPEFIAG
jgi:4-diphosphocytidyl-2-C-methyl-D-erythritol kinase